MDRSSFESSRNSTMSFENSNDLHVMLSVISQRLTNIENILKTLTSEKKDDMDYDSLDNLRDSIESVTTPMIENTDSDSDDDSTNMLIDESYDSENDIPTEKAEVFPESKLTLTSLQIQLASEEFMQYKNKSSDDEGSSESSL